jgi:hypothetical protein
MKRRIAAGTAALVLLAATASPAYADRGSPGSTFPEQASGAYLSESSPPATANVSSRVAVGGSIRSSVPLESPSMSDLSNGLACCRASRRCPRLPPFSVKRGPGRDLVLAR